MLKVQVFAKNVQQDVRPFSRWKTSVEDFGKRDLCSRLPSTRVRLAKHSMLVLANRKFPKVVYHEQEPVRGARARV
jgi:hypothetical protein